MIQTINPATGQALDEHEPLSDSGLADALARSERAFATHRATTFAERAAALHRLADLLERDADTHGRTMTEEMGKPLSQAVAEAKKCALVCRYYADHGERFLADDRRDTEAQRSFVAYQPLGPILAVMPWNFPYWQVFRFAAPTLMAGNVGLLKHASNVPACGDAIERLFREAGFVDDAFLHLKIDSDRVAEVIADARVRGVSLTGSEGAGRSVGKAAGEALKPSLLELGGADAFIVLADADLDRAVEVGLQARIQNSGQSCIAAKRFILEAPIAEEYTARFVEKMSALTVGDPMADGTDVGPLAREDLRDEVHDQVQRAVRDDATLLCGGEVPTGSGFYYPPTVLADVAEGSVAFEEEIFGPVASMTVAADADEAVRLANATRFGLGGSLWTSDLERGEKLARRIRSGGVFVNSMTKSRPNLPFGGIGDSGYGRELSREGILAFVNAKSIWID